MWDYVRLVLISLIVLWVVYRIGYRDGATKMLETLIENPELYEKCSEFTPLLERLKEAKSE